MSVFILLALLACSSGRAYTQVAVQPVRLPEREVALAGIRIGDTKTTVTGRFGAPLQETAEEALFCESEISVQYKDVEAYFCDGTLVNLISTSRRHRTPSGIHVGMTIERVIQLVGEPVRVIPLEDGSLAYYTEDRNLALILHVRRGKVASVELWTDFT